MSEKQCSLCGIVEADDISLPWFPGHTCSPKCARTKAIVEALDRLTDVFSEAAGIRIKRPLAPKGIADVVAWDKVHGR